MKENNLLCEKLFKISFTPDAISLNGKRKHFQNLQLPSHKNVRLFDS